jgi:glycosyltransferase involved in cell wall biosynthesis
LNVNAMRVLHAYNQHRGGGGANNATRATIDVLRQHGLDVEVYTRSSEEIAGPLARLEAGISAVYAPRSVRRFEALLDRFQPDLVHVHELFPLVSPWILPRCRRRNLPVVMSCVDYRTTCPVVTHLRGGRVCTSCVGGREHWAVIKNCRGNLLESTAAAAYTMLVRSLKLFSSNVSRFVAPSAFARNWLIEHSGIMPERITAIAPTVDIPAGAADPTQGSYVAFAGRFAEEKGVSVLIEAAGLSGVPVRLARNARSLVGLELPPDAQVVVTDSYESLSRFYRGARFLVFPSIWFETFGLVAAEAMGHGLPVIASRLGAMRELIEDQVDGLLFEPGNARDLADKILTLWNDPQRCREMGRAARLKADRLWSATRHYEKLIAVYEDLCP